MKLGGLFSGVGGFELAWTQLGHEVAWMCEIDRSARKVLEERFPGIPIYEDVEQLDPAEVEAVDVLTGGSPCQGFSVAGTRSGLEHGESRLFADYIRIMEGLAERGLKWALWENVPGVLSIQNDDGERTFEHVVAALVGGTEPVRLGQGRWNTGLADGGGRAVAWRVLDSRYFGVAQRRRRIFACVAFGDSPADRAGRALLAKSEGVPGDSASGEPTWKEPPPSIGGSLEDPRIAATVSAKWHKGTGGPSGSETGNLVSDDPTKGFRMTAFGQYEDDDSASTLKQRDHKDATDLVAQSWGMYGPSGQEGATLEEQPSITASHGQPGNVALAFRKSARAQSSEDSETWVDDGLANTVNTFDVGDSRTTHAIVEPLTIDFGRTSDRIRLDADTAATLQAGGGGAGAKTGLYMTEYGVRRLTPVECERLQAFPDGWTEPAGSDSARYKAMGNAVTVNTVRWILGRMLEQS